MAGQISAVSRMQRTPDGGFAALIVAGKFCHCLASCIALGNLPALASVEHRRAAEFRAFGFGSLDAGLAAFANHVPFKFGDA